MTAGVSAPIDPQQTWLKQAFAALQKAVGEPLELWTCEADGDWHAVVDSSDEAATFDIEPSTDECPELIDALQQAADRQAPYVTARETARHLVAIPLIDRDGSVLGVASTTVATDTPELLVNLATMSQRHFRQEEQLVRMREENEYFLKQVSDDFEELTFLRSMAEHLSLGDHTRKVDELIHDAVPMLGESVSCESLYFVDGGQQTPEISKLWHASGINEPIGDSLVLDLVEEYRAAAETQPVIKNCFPATPVGLSFPGVHEFVLVSISTSMGQVGWFLAVNRSQPRSVSGQHSPKWRLSQNEFGSSEASLLSTAGAMLASHANNLSLFRERETLLVNVVRTLVFAIEAKDPYTCGHSERVALYGKRLAQQVGFDEQACELLYLTGLLHDVGKIAVSDTILNKPDRLTDEEFDEIKRHPDEGWKILQELDQLRYVLPGVLHHHERPDGKGYPDQLRGNDIPLDGRVLAVADAYDAMTSDRAYREGMSQAKAEEILRAGSGTQWDPQVIDAFFTIVPEIEAIRNSYQLRERPDRHRSNSVSNV